MLDAASVDALARSFMLGADRHVVPVERAFGGLIAPDDPKATLKMLALLGQHNRFRRPARGAARLSAEPLFPDARAIVADEARPLLMSLLSGKGASVTDAVPLAIADAMKRRNLRLHPFDLPRLDDFVQSHGDQLGASAIAWTERRAATTTTNAYSLVETIDETNWSQGRPAQKAAFIRALRATDPAHARALVESALASEQAPVRVALVKALAENLSLTDGPFLEGLAKDRAPSVREAVEALLARLPGSLQAAKRLRDGLSRITKAKGRLPRRRTVLELEYPATVTVGQREGWAIATFGAIPLDDFARGLDLSIDEIASAVADDQILTRVLAMQASRAQRYDLVARLVRESAPSAWIAMVQSNDFEFSKPESAVDWSAAAIQPDLWPEMPGAVELMRLYEKLGVPLPEPTAERLLASKVWRHFLAKSNETVQASMVFSSVAVLVPPSLRPTLRGNLAALPADITARAFGVMTLLDVIETA